MARAPKPTFITELPLVASLAQDAVMQGRFEAGRRLFNAVLGDALKGFGSHAPVPAMASGQSFAQK